MIILITYKDEEGDKIYVSHGYNTETDQNIVLPQIPLFYYDGDYYFDRSIGENVLKQNHV